ncbi:MAG: amidohydrolase family protein [Geminicoccaceae bacterium]
MSAAETATLAGTVLERRRQKPASFGIVDCDIHHSVRAKEDLYPYLAQRWQRYLEDYGFLRPEPFIGQPHYPKTAPALARRDAWPTNGGPPGSDLDFMREQLLDPFNIDFGMLHYLFFHGMEARNIDLGVALCRAANQWQEVEWTSKEPRLKAAIVVPGENAAAAVAEIEHWAGNPGFVQVSLTSHGIEPLGRQRYWPIYEAAAAHGLPVGLHVSGANGLPPSAGIGWPSYYVERHHEVAISHQAITISLALEGVLARFPTLKVVMVEGGFAWVPSLCWRLDQQWARMRDEVPDVTRPPSEYILEQMWFTTQPLDEPERADDILEIMDWIGWDRVLFASDYPHWDFDDPDRAFKVRMTEDQRRLLFSDNARAVYDLPPRAAAGSKDGPRTDSR